jgi:hypothetical protein
MNDGGEKTAKLNDVMITRNRKCKRSEMDDHDVDDWKNRMIVR